MRNAAILIVPFGLAVVLSRCNRPPEPVPLGGGADDGGSALAGFGGGAATQAGSSMGGTSAGAGAQAGASAKGGADGTGVGRGGEPNAQSNLVACDDGTGNTDCCAEDIAAGVPCSVPDLQCFTKCAAGWRGHLICSQGAWIAGLGLLSCGSPIDAGQVGDTGQVDVAHGDESIQSASQCKWPSPDAGYPFCRMARALVSCTGPSGDGCSGLADDASGSPACGPYNQYVCTNHCTDGEYAAACGQIGPGSAGSTDPPDPACRSIGAIPAGIVEYCCPCQ